MHAYVNIIVLSISMQGVIVVHSAYVFIISIFGPGILLSFACFFFYRKGILKGHLSVHVKNRVVITKSNLILSIPGLNVKLVKA